MALRGLLLLACCLFECTTEDFIITGAFRAKNFNIYLLLPIEHMLPVLATEIIQLRDTG